MKKNKQPVVYIVDDECEFVHAMSMLLNAAGIHNRTFTSPGPFLRKVHPGDPGCILLDVRMPGKSGLEVQDALITRNCRQPVIFLTGHGDIPMAVQATRAGALDFLEKPVRQRVLLHRVRAALKLDAERRQAEAADNEARHRVTALTRREAEIGQLLIKGMSSAGMARELKLSVRTVEMHRLRMMRRLGVNNTAQAVRMMLESNP